MEWLKNKEERKARLFRRIEILVNKSDIYLYIFEKLFIHLLNNYTNLEEKDNFIIELFTKLDEFVNDLKSFSFIFKDKFKATIVYFCLKNKLIYVNLIKKLYPDKNYSSIEFVIRELNKKGILRPVEKNELMKEKAVFNHFILRNSPNAGHYQVQKIKYYCLTHEAFKFFTSFEEHLSKVADKRLVEDFKRKLAMTHKELEKLAEKKDIELKRCVEILFRAKNNPLLSTYTKTWAEKILPKYGVYVSPDFLEKIIKGSSSQFDALQKLNTVVLCERKG